MLMSMDSGAHGMLWKREAGSKLCTDAVMSADCRSLAAVVMTAESAFRTVGAAKHHRLADWGSIC